MVERAERPRAVVVGTSRAELNSAVERYEAVSNTGESAIHDWLGLVPEVAPRAVQIYTIDRAPEGVDIRPVAAVQLEEIACRLRAQSGIEARVYS